ncbi:flagellar export protein FliJ [Lawsonia intracellularis]|uniref:Flagellar FliJ protein n=1 Tax=Lawsonia intracellularis (strain PHE/MN1-00) TaxID=363253 RepID=Q1MPG3_LAWIP|nr:flagellar export protein FliJ [Lawsonia intracellularis]AGC50495.1 flagellar export protein FliJ [Lawsonia intracellularis N343]KAA0204514.1 flagellar export protein FliJ [Lawsonia intracellularis]MBZ3892944.1 flagellar export protein FliJ [Lawsonia intracellularis]OMQ02303.1 flagellar export protein FliJ [Lawsonia intracellularis]RBN32901.1 flagellar export protein FliJ [Lawsonia intracellularis]
MAAFRFSLQQVLDYREQLSEQARVELAKVTAAVISEERKVKELQEAIHTQETNLRALDLNNIGERWLLENFIKGLQEDLRISLAQLQTLQNALKEAQGKVAQLAKEHKVLEKLKSKQAERHAKSERQKEQQNYDETASIRFNSKTF